MATGLNSGEVIFDRKQTNRRKRNLLHCCGSNAARFLECESDAHQTCGYHSLFNRKLNCDRLRSRTTESTG